jgi:hypothetical protein
VAAWSRLAVPNLPHSVKEKRQQRAELSDLHLFVEHHDRRADRLDRCGAHLQGIAWRAARATETGRGALPWGCRR